MSRGGLIGRGRAERVSAGGTSPRLDPEAVRRCGKVLPVHPATPYPVGNGSCIQQVTRPGGLLHVMMTMGKIL